MREFLELQATNGNTVFVAAEEIVLIGVHTEKSCAVSIAGNPTPVLVATPAADLLTKLEAGGYIRRVVIK